MFKYNFLHAVLAGVLAFVASLIYTRIYFFATEADYSPVLNPLKLAALSILTCMLAAVLNYLLEKLLKKNGALVFNVLFSILSFAAVMIPISMSLPLNIKFPELFPGLAVPMVFFPAIAWYTVDPLFVNKG